MRYLIFGDVHGNLPALEQLFKIERGQFDLAISHGDVVNYGPWSNECVEFLEDNQSIISLAGNHEEYFLDGNYRGVNEVAKSFFNECYPKFLNFDKIKNYNNNYNIKNYCIQHTIYDRYIFPDSDLKEIKLNNNYIIGHSHYQFSKNVNGKILVNTGSLGQNRKHLNVSEYIILDESTDLVELKSFKNDIDKVISKMEMVNYPQICINYYKGKARI